MLSDKYMMLFVDICRYFWPILHVYFYENITEINRSNYPRSFKETCF